jgi:nucleotide-binding universal stress UspA family protein
MCKGWLTTKFPDLAKRNSDAEGHRYKGFKVISYSLYGDPREEIAKKTKEVGADILVIGSRGMGSMKRLLLGSVSKYW